MDKKIINISIDIDNVHHYLAARGYKPNASTNVDSIYHFAIPRMLDLFDEYEIKATFFVVGADAKKYSQIIRDICKRGHEIGNHTYNHFQHFGMLNAEDMEFEIVECNNVLEDITGEKVVGFRAPGWNISKYTLPILEANGFTYDSSVYPSKIIPLLNLFNYFTNKGKMPFSMGNNFKIGFSDKKAYYPDFEKFWKPSTQRSILEIPPTVIPGLNLPFLGTSLYKFGKPLYNFSKKIAENYFDLILFELHAIEMVDSKEVNDDRLSVKPGFKFSMNKKNELYHYFLKSFEGYDSLTLKEITSKYA